MRREFKCLVKNLFVQKKELSEGESLSPNTICRVIKGVILKDFTI